MSRDYTRREVLGHAARGAALLGLGGVTGLLCLKAQKTHAWMIDPGKCINSKLGAVGVEQIPILADEALRGRRNMTTGANQDDFHLRGVDVERDIRVGEWLDLREVTSGEPCPACEAPLAVRKTIEVGHIFKLGTRFSESLGASVLDEASKGIRVYVPYLPRSQGLGGRDHFITCGDEGHAWTLGNPNLGQTHRQ